MVQRTDVGRKMTKTSDTIVETTDEKAGNVIAVIEFVPVTNKRDALIQALRYVGEHVRLRPECISCGVFEAADSTMHVLYVEQWESPKGLDAHIRSSLYLRILQAMELAAEAPKISFHEISRTRSLELIEQLRSRI
jgi:quinol monooxygenase YgiN